MEQNFMQTEQEIL